MKSIVNFRDMGGLKTEDGRRVKHGRLLRSGELVQVSKGDLAELQAVYGLRLIVDLRSENEALAVPDDMVGNAVYKNIPLHKRQEKPAKSPEEKEFRKLSEESQVVDFMTRVYENMVLDPYALAGFSEVIRLARGNREGSLLFHCFAGKDRTGVMAAILYKLLGVGDGEILAEYLITNELRKARNEEILEKARREGESEARIAALKVSYEVRPEYLGRVFEITSERDGSFLKYIQNNMNVSDGDITGLKDNYLE